MTTLRLRGGTAYATTAVVAGLAGLALPALASRGGISSKQELAGAAVIAAGAVLLAALARGFETYVYVMIAVRVSSDVFATSNDQALGLKASGSLASLFLGATFVVLAVLFFLRLDRLGERRPTSRPVMLLFLYALACFFSVAGAAHRSVAFTGALRVLAGVLMLAVLEQLLPGRPDRVKRVLGAIIFSSFVPAALAFYQLATGTGDHQTSGFERLYGTSVDAPEFGIYLIFVVFALIAAYRERFFNLALLRIWGAVCVVLIYLSYARSAWIALVLGLVVGLGKLNRRGVAALLVVVAVIAVGLPSAKHRFADLSAHRVTPNAGSANSVQWRFGYWREVLATPRNPVLGLGIDNVPLTTTTGQKPHDLFVEAYVETGLLGLVTLVAALLAFAFDLRQRRRMAFRTGDPFDRTIASIGLGVGVALLAAALVNNENTQTITWWYLAAAMCWGFGRPAAAAVSHRRAQLGVSPLAPPAS